MPDPLLPVAIVAHAKADDDKLSQGLAAAGRRGPDDAAGAQPRDPPARVCGAWARRTSTSCSTGCATATASPSTPCRCGCRCARRSPAAAKGHGRHVKQSGGHGQFAVCDIEVEPLPQGSGFEFVDKVVGGAVPRQFIPSVEKGVRAQMERGVAAGYPVIDLRVTLVDGKAHSVDSSDMAFQTAGALALKEAAKGDAVHMLEPVDEVGVLVADEYVGAVMSDLSEPARPGRRHRAGRRRAARWSGPRSPSWRSPATPSTCARCRTARARSPGRTPRHEPMPHAARRRSFSPRTQPASDWRMRCRRRVARLDAKRGRPGPGGEQVRGSR